jgi:uncharacterized protein (TIGR03086 family)
VHDRRSAVPPTGPSSYGEGVVDRVVPSRPVSEAVEEIAVNLIEHYRRSMGTFLDRVGQIGPGDWDLPTPCTEWNVRQLVNHVVYEDRWTAPMMAGLTVEDVGTRFDGDLLGDDPIGRSLDAAKQAETAISAPGALDRTVALSFGPTPAREYAWQLLAEHLVHAWDLAAAIGADRRLDPDAVRACAAWFADREQLFREMGVIGSRVHTRPTADEQDRLLGGYGRDPRWSGP